MRRLRSRGLRVALSLAILAVFVLGADAVQARTDQVPASPQASKQAARTLLAGLPGDAKTSARLADAAAAIEKSLTPAWWTGDSTLDPQQGDGVFAAERDAAQALAKIKSPPAEVGDAVDLLVAADRGLAQTALALAAAGGAAKEVAKAQKDVDKAEDQAAKGHAPQAIDFFGKAWRNAVDAAPSGPRTITLTTCGIGELTDAIRAANATEVADTIVLKAGCTYTVTAPVPESSANGLPVIVQPLTIHGSGATLARDPSAPALQLLEVQGWSSSEGFAVDRLTVRGGSAFRGAALYVHPAYAEDGSQLAASPSVTVTGSTFADNTLVRTDALDPGGSGGAIYLEGMSGPRTAIVTLGEDVFSDNATHGGPAPLDPNSYDQRAGGAVFVGWGFASARIDGCTFVGNRTGDAPDGWEDSYTNVGGAVLSFTPLSVANSVFQGNVAGTAGLGGAIAFFDLASYAGPGIGLTLERNTFERNAAGFGGGAVVLFSDSGRVGVLSDTGSTFTGNDGGRFGGAINASSGDVTLTGDHFEENTADRAGGVYVWVGDPDTTLTIASAVFDRNTGRGGEGAISINGGTTRISDATFTGNANASGMPGAGAVSAGGTLLVDRSSFTDNTNSGPAGAIDGAGFGPDGLSAITVTDSTFSDNEGSEGAAITTSGLGSTLTLVHSTFTGNTGLSDGAGVVAAGNARLSVTDSVFEENDVGSWAGAIFARGDASIVRTRFAGNTSNAIVWSSGDADRNPHVLAVIDGTFEENGGGINGGMCTFVTEQPCSDLALITGSTFDRNRGDAIWLNGPTPGWPPSMSDHGTLVVANSTVTGNATPDGSWGVGGIHFGYGPAYLTNVTVVGNEGTDAGGVLADRGAVITIANSIVADNPDRSGQDGQRNCNASDGSAIVDGGGNLTTATSWGCPASFLVGDPVLLPLAGNGGPTETMALGPGSAAIDAANDGVCLAPVGPLDYGAGGVDQRGVARPQGAHCDIGAFEPGP